MLAGTIDLSELNVPAGQEVAQGLFTEGPSNDALGLGVRARPGRVPPSLLLSKSTVVPGDLVLDWAASCSIGAEDYGIHEGTLGTWYDHTAIDCADAAADTVERITPAAGDRYYLVVPRIADLEGSYGVSAAGADRPVGLAPCAPAQDAAGCP